MLRRSNGRDSEANGSGSPLVDYFKYDFKKLLDKVDQGKFDKDLAGDMQSELLDLHIAGAPRHGMVARLYEILRPAHPSLTYYKVNNTMHFLEVESKRSRQETSPAEALPEAKPVSIPGNPPSRRMSGRQLVLINKWHG